MIEKRISQIISKFAVRKPWMNSLVNSHTFKHVILNAYLKLENYVMKNFVNFMNANLCTCITLMNLCILFIYICKITTIFMFFLFKKHFKLNATATFFGIQIQNWKNTMFLIKNFKYKIWSILFPMETEIQL